MAFKRELQVEAGFSWIISTCAVLYTFYVRAYSKQSISTCTCLRKQAVVGYIWQKYINKWIKIFPFSSNSASPLWR